MKRYKILLISELDNPLWNDGWYYKEGLEINGHEVAAFDPAAVNEPVKEVYEIISAFGPDFILHTKDELPAEIFNEMRKAAKVVQWYPDPVIPGWLPPYVKSSDVFITMTEGLVSELKKISPNVFFLTQAFAPSFFRIENITESDTKEYSADVTFVGNLGSKPQYSARRQFLQSVVNNGFNLKWWGPRLPRKLSTIPLILGSLGRSYGGKFVWGEEHAKIARLSKIYLGLDSMPHLRKSMSERLYIAVGCGAFYMCQYVEGIEDFLEPDREIVTFRSEQEMLDKIGYYLKNDGLRNNIVQAGQTRVLKEHTYEVRMKQLLEIVESVL